MPLGTRRKSPANHRLAQLLKMNPSSPHLNAALERMTCKELAGLVALNSRIADAKHAGDRLEASRLEFNRDTWLRIKSTAAAMPEGLNVAQN